MRLFICLLLWLPNKALGCNPKKILRESTRQLIGDESQIHFILVPKNSQVQSEKNLRKLLESPLYDQNKPTIFYVFGYLETPYNGSAEVVTKALLQKGSHNIFIIDWNPLNLIVYTTSVINTFKVGKYVAEQLDKLFAEQLLSISKVYIIGHSLGAQVAGYIGRNIQTGSIPRITGLDPANPGYQLYHLKKTDAQFVDIIHTDGNYYGLLKASGHADFYPNHGSRFQPGCPSKGINSVVDFCSHHRSFQYFAISVADEQAYPAAKCSHIFSRKLNCDIDNIAYMGFGVSNSSRGSFYLETSLYNISKQN